MSLIFLGIVIVGFTFYGVGWKNDNFLTVALALLAIVISVALHDRTGLP